MSININIGDSELEIMKVLWSSSKPMTSTEINSAVAHKQWKKTTIATFLTRLTEKNAVTADKQGKIYYYTAAISAKEYKKSQTKNLIRNLYNGSVKDFAAALFEDTALSQKDLQELKAIFDEKEE